MGNPNSGSPSRFWDSSQKSNFQRDCTVIAYSNNCWTAELQIWNTCAHIKRYRANSHIYVYLNLPPLHGIRVFLCRMTDRSHRRSCVTSRFLITIAVLLTFMLCEVVTNILASGASELSTFDPDRLQIRIRNIAGRRTNRNTEADGRGNDPLREAVDLLRHHFIRRNAFSSADWDGYITSRDEYIGHYNSKNCHNENFQPKEQESQIYETATKQVHH